MKAKYIEIPLLLFFLIVTSCTNNKQDENAISNGTENVNTAQSEKYNNVIKIYIKENDIESYLSNQGEELSGFILADSNGWYFHYNGKITNDAVMAYSVKMDNWIKPIEDLQLKGDQLSFTRTIYCIGDPNDCPTNFYSYGTLSDTFIAHNTVTNVCEQDPSSANDVKWVLTTMPDIDYSRIPVLKNVLEGNFQNPNDSPEDIAFNELKQKTKHGEKLIRLKWGTENKTRINKDMNRGFRPCSEYKVPLSKKWVLLYLNEDYIYDNGDVISRVPYLSINGELEEFYNRSYSQYKNINLSQAKDENLKYYSGTNLKFISTNSKGGFNSDNFNDYLGEVWFLEIDE